MQHSRPPSTPSTSVRPKRKQPSMIYRLFCGYSPGRAFRRSSSIKYGTSTVWPEQPELLLGGLSSQEVEQRAQRMLVSTWEDTHNPVKSKRAAWGATPGRMNASGDDHEGRRSPQSVDETDGEMRPIFIEEWMWGRVKQPSRPPAPA